MRALLVLLRAEGATVTREALADACWDGRVVSDDAINRVISLLRALARRFDPPPFELHTVPKIGFRLETRGAAHPLPAPAPAAADAPRRPNRTLVLVWVSALLAAAVLGGAAWFAGRALFGPPSGRVQVASFQALPAGDAEVARMASATRSALVRVLRSADIPVVEAPLSGAGSAAKADFHVRGAVDRDGDAIVVNVQLLDRRGRSLLWSGREERSLLARARFPDQAANRIGDTIYCALHSRATSKRRMTDPVLSLMLQACETRRLAADEAPRFLAAAERVRAAAPGLSGAQSIYAVAAASQSVVSPDAPDAPALATAARVAARRALELDPANGEAYFAVGLSYGFDGAWLEREANFTRAETLTKGFSVVRDLHVGVLREVGRLDEARDLNRRTVADDPFSPDQLSTLILLTAVAEGPEAAEPLLQRLRLLAAPEQADDVRFTILFWWGEPKAAALLAAAKASSSAQERACFQTYLGNLGRPGPHHGLPDACRAVQADWRIRMLAREGDVEGAYRETGQAARASSRLIALYYPEMRAFRADARFMRLAARYGLVDYWLRSGHWPDFCADPKLPYDCRAAATVAASAPRQDPPASTR